jgi:hypothetical protein
MMFGKQSLVILRTDGTERVHTLEPHAELLNVKEALRFKENKWRAAMRTADS